MKSDETVTFGELILRLRMNRQLTQDALAQDCHSSRKHISNIENNKEVPNYTLICELAEKLEVEPLLLFTKLGERANKEMAARKARKKDKE